MSGNRRPVRVRSGLAVLTVAGLIEELSKQDAHKLVMIPAVVVYRTVTEDRVEEADSFDVDADAGIEDVRNQGAYVLLSPGSVSD
jgi:hypothetical protein